MEINLEGQVDITWVVSAAIVALPFSFVVLGDSFIRAQRKITCLGITLTLSPSHHVSTYGFPLYTYVSCMHVCTRHMNLQLTTIVHCFLLHSFCIYPWCELLLSALQFSFPIKVRSVCPSSAISPHRSSRWNPGETFDPTARRSRYRTMKILFFSAITYRTVPGASSKIRDSGSLHHRRMVWQWTIHVDILRALISQHHHYLPLSNPYT